MAFPNRNEVFRQSLGETKKLGENASGRDKNIFSSLIQFFFYGGPQAGWATRTVILPVPIQTGMKKLRCVFNYQISRVYAFHTLNTSSVYTRLISQSS